MELMAAVDDVVEKMEQQLRKYKQKVQDRHRGAGHRQVEAPESRSGQPVRENSCMKFADFICREAIRADLEAADKEGAIREMVQALVDAKRVDAERSSRASSRRS